jgi:hypothetical protein
MLLRIATALGGSWEKLTIGMVKISRIFGVNLVENWDVFKNIQAKYSG